MAPSAALPLALTMGEPGGIGPDITIMAWAARRTLRLPSFYWIGDPALLAGRARTLGIDCALSQTDAASAGAVFQGALPVVPLAAAVSATAGIADPKNAPAVVESIRRAVASVEAGDAAAVVTNPIQKATLTAAGFAHAGHTEFLAELAALSTGRPQRAVMMLAGPRLRAVPVTVHIPLRAVPTTLSRELIVETGRIAAADLRRRFAVAMPRIAVAGLNPHAGEDGTIGDEDERIVRPAVAALVAAGVAAFGPVPADSLFREAALVTYDAVLCMYHDQALIPVKTLAFSETVNVTLGLPFVRTSPDHGTALDLAGSGRADPTNLIAALRLAAVLAGRSVAA